MRIIKFEDLEIWQLSIAATKDIYRLTLKGEFNKDWGLKEQIQRAVVSISSNIVEGFEKNSNNEFVRFLKIAKGSTGEVRNQLYIALTLGYINKEEFDKIEEKMVDLAKQIGGFKRELSSLVSRVQDAGIRGL